MACLLLSAIGWDRPPGRRRGQAARLGAGV